jgi:citronellol/citronellal dehydrogenase
MITEQLDLTGRSAIINVVIAARTADELEAAAARIAEESGSRCIAIPTDVKNEEAIIRLVACTADAFGTIDILVNNAGGTRMGPLEHIPTRGWDSIFDLNMKSAYICTREAGRHMIAQKSGAIVNISSGAGVTGVRGGAHYSAAKSALQMFTRVTAAEWGKHGIRVNCVAPGVIASPRAAEAWRVANLDAEAMAANVPLGRTGRPDEMANMIVFLASDAASYVSGQTIAVNGGPVLPGIPDD